MIRSDHMNPQTKKRAATTRQGPGRWLFVFPALLLVAAVWFALHPWQSSANSPVGKEFTEDLYNPDRYRVLPGGVIEDTATGLRRKLDSARTGSSPSQADIRSFISLTDDQRADLRNGVGPRPVRVVVDGIGVDAGVIPIGLDVNRALAVPRDAQITGWWSGGFVPGENGPTVIVGHFDSKVAAGVFAKLQSLRKGEQITVEDSIGSKYVYEVVEMQHLRKTAFPTEKVYGPSEGSTLRLITCGGKFNRATGHYVDNTIAYAVLVSAEIVGQVDPRPAGEDLPIKIAPVFPLLYLDDFEDYVDPGTPGGSGGSGGFGTDGSSEDFPVPGQGVDSSISTTTTATGLNGSTAVVSVPTVVGGGSLGEVPGIPSTPSGVVSGGAVSTLPVSSAAPSSVPVSTLPALTVPAAFVGPTAPAAVATTIQAVTSTTVAASVPGTVAPVPAGVTVPPAPTLPADSVSPNVGGNSISPEL